MRSWGVENLSRENSKCKGPGEGAGLVSFLKKYIFIWLLQVLVAAFGTFSCSIWDPVPTRPLRWEPGILVTGPSGKSQAWCLEGKKPA